MKFSLEFDMDNAAFHPASENELHRILSKIAKDAGNGHSDGTIFDVNGNKIGAWAIEGENPRDSEVVAFWVVDYAGDYIARFPKEGEAEEGDLSSFYTDAKRDADGCRADAIEEREEDGEDYPNDPAHVSYVVAVEYRDGTRSCEHGWG